MSESRGG